MGGHTLAMDRKSFADPDKKKPADVPVLTEKLQNDLINADDFSGFARENTGAFFDGTVSGFIEGLLTKYNISKSDAIERADIERGYGYQILRGIRDAKRDKFIRLAIGIGLDLKDTQRLLTVAKQGILYPKILRDAVIIFSINNRYNIVKLQLLLDEQGAAPLE